MEDTLSATLVPPGTEEFSVPPNPVPPGTEDPLSQTKVEEDVSLITLEELTESAAPPDSTLDTTPILGRRSPSQGDLDFSSSNLDRRATLMPGSRRLPDGVASKGVRGSLGGKNSAVPLIHSHCML